MSFTGIYKPEQLAVLAKVLNDHCASHGITPSSPEYTDASYLIMSLSQKGVGTVEELQAGLEGGVIATARGLKPAAYQATIFNPDSHKRMKPTSRPSAAIASHFVTLPKTHNPALASTPAGPIRNFAMFRRKS
jgi:hypothetical protein